MNKRSHPIRELLDQLAIGDTLTADDLRELPLADNADRYAIERTIRGAAKAIATARTAGARGEARAIALETAAHLVDRAGDPPPERDGDLPTDPRGLAARIGRW